MPIRMRIAVACPALAAAVVLSAFGLEAWAQSMMDQMIFSQCSAAMNTDYAKAGQTPPDGLVQKTCDCVVKKIGETHNIDLSKQLCTKQATAGG